MYRTATAFLEALQEAGVSYLFANFGSDHPPILESIAEARASGRAIPAVITCPNEMVALSAAQGYAQATGRGQAVLVHVDVGTQSLAGALHNASRCRVPVLIFSGAVPFTQQGELPGSRNEFIHWLQDVFDQRGIVRGYVKYDNEIRSGRNIRQIIRRALQIAHSDPQGPVYLMAAREVLEEEIPAAAADSAPWPAIAPGAMAASSVDALVADLLAASRPLVVTSYVGRNPAAVEELVRLCRRLAIGVLESVPNYLNFPADNVLYLGSQWNEQRQHPALAEADCILVIDSDIPWIPTVNRPASGARIHHIDVDPLKEKMPLWSIPAKNVCRADALTALRQINDCLDTVHLDGAVIERRRAHYAALHAERERVLRERERQPAEVITPEFLTACVREHLNSAAGGETLVLNEAITSYNTVTEHLCATSSRHGFRQRRIIARMERRSGHRHEACAPGKNRRVPHRRRLVSVFGSGDGALDGAALSHAFSADRLQQSRLEGSEDVGVGGASGGLRQPGKRSGRELRSASRLRGNRGGLPAEPSRKPCAIPAS